MACKGYKAVSVREHPRAKNGHSIHEHILVAEKKLGRYLKAGEIVHHIDENIHNNNPENLMVFATASDHLRYHHNKNAILYQDGDVWRTKAGVEKECEYCKKIFIVTEKHKIDNQRFCSMSCRAKYKQTNNKENLESFQKMIELLKLNNGNIGKTARELNVTRNAIKSRLKNHGLPYHSADYRTNN